MTSTAATVAPAFTGQAATGQAAPGLPPRKLPAGFELLVDAPFTRRHAGADTVGLLLATPGEQPWTESPIGFGPPTDRRDAGRVKTRRLADVRLAFGPEPTTMQLDVRQSRIRPVPST